VAPAELSALVLGAGGSARAAVWALAGAGAADVAIWNRTPARAEQLARELGARAVPAPTPADILVNCTSVGLEPPAAGGVEDPAGEAATLHQLKLTPDQIGRYPYVVDLVYNGQTTPLLALARRAGCETVDGLQILLAQGALSFTLWTARAAPIEAMRTALAEPRDQPA
jgi:shikimate dehydrogenase